MIVELDCRIMKDVMYCVGIDVIEVSTILINDCIKYNVEEHFTWL